MYIYTSTHKHNSLRQSHTTRARTVHTHTSHHNYITDKDRISDFDKRGRQGRRGGAYIWGKGSRGIDNGRLVGRGVEFGNS